MPDDLYERDILAWSELHADLLGRGKQVNDVDWANVTEEIEGVGRSQLHSVESFLTSIMVHLLRLHAWPDSSTRNHWRGEIVGFQFEANRRFTPSLRQRLNIDQFYGDALRQMRAGAPGASLPAGNPFTLDDLPTEDDDVLLSRLPPQA